MYDLCTLFTNKSFATDSGNDFLAFLFLRWAPPFFRKFTLETKGTEPYNRRQILERGRENGLHISNRFACGDCRRLYL